MEYRLESIRARSRTELSADRSHQRNAELNRRRLLDQTSYSEGTASVEQIADMLKTASAISVTILNRLKNNLLSENSIEAFLKTNGALRGLVRELTGTDTAKQCAAAACLCNLALSNARSAHAVGKAAGAYLVLYLRSFSTDLAMICTWTLGNLAGAHARVCDLLTAQGAISGLTSLLSYTVHEEIRRASCYALIHFAYVLKSDMSVGALSDLTRVLSGMKRNAPAYHLLFLLSCHPHFLSPETTNSDFVLSVLGDLTQTCCSDADKQETSDEISHIVRTLANLCVVPSCSDHVLFHWQDPKNFAVVEMILLSKSDKLRNSMNWLLGNIFCNRTQTTENLSFFQAVSNKML